MVSLIGRVMPAIFTVPLAVATMRPPTGAVTLVAIESVAPASFWVVSRVTVVVATALNPPRRSGAGVRGRVGVTGVTGVTVGGVGVTVVGVTVDGVSPVGPTLSGPVVSVCAGAADVAGGIRSRRDDRPRAVRRESGVAFHVPLACRSVVIV